VIAGNKVDLDHQDHEIFIEDVKEWLEEEHGENK
jgi:hypothetical protein